MSAEPTGSDREGAGRRQIRCITCSDDGRWMRVLEVDVRRALALCVDADGADETVDTGIVAAVAPGDSLLVHAGTALQRRETQ
ncbi:MAG TPA: HypC/HybG/HupF family hydrogenase formation chaperone [Solirubrobacteraceae bacterium]|nr:HypC/HybG/HupF family hydrogenase formation chaperone [Solirubrobacteraceae bacterium]